MRILWVTNDLPPRAGGIEQFIGNLLDRGPVKQTVVIGPPNDEAVDHDARQQYEIVRHDAAVRPSLSLLRRVREVAAEHRPDVIVLGAAWPLGELAGAFARDPGVPTVALSHGHEAGLVSVGLGYLVRRATRNLAALTTISDFTEERLGRHVQAAWVERIPPGVDVDLFRPEVDGAPLREAWGIPADALLVGCISRLVARKGQDTLLEVWPRLKTGHPDAWLAIIGTGPLEERLREQARSLGSGAQVVLPGRVPWEALPGCYAALDVFAMPCRTRWGGLDVEGLGIVYLEAQACGVPVVAGRSGGAPETVRDGDTGLVVDGTDADAVGAAIDGLLTDPARRERMGTRGREHAVGRWSWTAIGQRFYALLDRVVAAGLPR